MSGHILLDALNEPDELAPTQANFPALQHFFPMDEASGAVSITDSVNGVEVAGVVTRIPSNAPSAQLSGETDIALLAGTWEKPLNRDILMVVSVATGGSSLVCNFGHTSGAPRRGIQYAGFLDRGRIGDGDADADNTSVTGDDDSIFGVAFRHGIDLQVYRDSTAAGIVEGTPETVVASTIDMVTNDGFEDVSGLTWATSSVHAVALFYFDTLPDDVGTALQWMREQWKNGNKVIYPGWRGLT